ncbi:hypothetical protein [Catenulispora pinisilvae]|uniref:hypothetical protein n=1 Tax=Catenulispora pinisilvae TaxID=2705253 RepID=UPI0018910EFF|nr:hypothetical protein [Catenulispora pinisilvae]
MDISTLLLPGAQKLAQAMLGDAWNMTRDALARRWGHGDRAVAEAAAKELDDSREHALALFGSEQADEAQLNAFIAGYLAALTRTEPERIHDLVNLEPAPSSSEVTIGNINTGQVAKLAQVDGDVHGGLHM